MMLGMFEKSAQEGQMFDYLDDLGFHASNPENGWSSKKKLYDIMWEIQGQLSACPTFEGEKTWVKDRKKVLGIK